MLKIDLDQLLDQAGPVCEVSLGKKTYEVYAPDDLPESSRLRFYDVRAEMADVYEKVQIAQEGGDRPPLREFVMMQCNELPLMRRYIEALCQMPDKALDKGSGNAIRQIYNQINKALPKELVETEAESVEESSNGSPKNEELPESNLTTTSSKS